MTEYGLPILYALFVWWFSTGLIMYLDGLPRSTFKWSLLAATAVLIVCVYRLAATSNDTSVAAAYGAFTYGVLAWGWQAMTFYMGAITGPVRSPCPPGATGWTRFRLAAGTCLYHEIALLLGGLVIVVATQGGANSIGIWTYATLSWMHLSGKLNVFLGAPNLAEEFIPEHLAYLRSYMARKPMNLLFPISVTVSTVVTVVLVQKAMAYPPGSFEATGFTFLATLMALAVLEHWFLVLPMPAMMLWAWSLASRQVVDRPGSVAPSVRPDHPSGAGAGEQAPSGKVGRDTLRRMLALPGTAAPPATK